MKRIKRRYAKRYWEDWYEDAKEYYNANGDLLINRHYTTDDGYCLGRWIERQRSMLAENQLPPEKVAKLNKIGIFAWKESGDEEKENINSANR